MTYIEIPELNPVNLFEVYVCQSKYNTDPKHAIDLQLDPHIVSAIENKFHNPKSRSFKSYYMNDKIYTYELANDNQIVTAKHMVTQKIIKRSRMATDVVITGYKIEKYPPYLFPCTNEIDYISSYTIKEYKINNRLTVNVKEEDSVASVYIEYKHSDHVELEKINEIIGKLLNRL